MDCETIVSFSWERDDVGLWVSRWPSIGSWETSVVGLGVLSRACAEGMSRAGKNGTSGVGKGVVVGIGLSYNCSQIFLRKEGWVTLVCFVCSISIFLFFPDVSPFSNLTLFGVGPFLEFFFTGVERNYNCTSFPNSCFKKWCFIIK